MNEPSPNPDATPNSDATEQIASIVADSDAAWRRSGVGATQRRRLATELREELRAAHDDGFAVRNVLGDDVAAGAVEWAREQGLTGRDPRYRSFVPLVTMPVVIALLAAFGLSRNHSEEGGGFVLAGYAVCIAFAYAGALFTARRLLARHGDERRARSVQLLARTLPVAGVAAALAGVAVAASTGFDSSPGVVVSVLLVVVAVFAATVTGARRRAVRSAVAA